MGFCGLIAKLESSNPEAFAADFNPHSGRSVDTNFGNSLLVDLFSGLKAVTGKSVNVLASLVVNVNAELVAHGGDLDGDDVIHDVFLSAL